MELVRGTMKELAARFSVSYGWVRKIAASERETGSVTRVSQRRAASRIDPAMVRRLVATQPDAVVAELCERMRAQSVSISTTHLWRVLQKMDLPLKKVTPRHRAGHGRKPLPPRGLRRNRPPDCAGGLDLSGRKRCVHADDPMYAHAPRGKRVHDTVPGGHWKMLTILGALDHTGMLAVMTVEAATDREVFLVFLDQVLCPKLRAGHVVVMDNLSAHKVDGVRQRIEARGLGCFICRPTHRTSIPSRKPGPSSNNAFAAQPHVRSRGCNKPSRTPSSCSPPQDANAWLRLRFG